MAWIQLDRLAMLDILHQGLKRKLSQVEDAIKATDDEIGSIEELAKTENSEVEELEHRLAELKQVVSRRSAIIQGKRLKLSSLSLDEFKLRRKIKSCEEAKNDIASKSLQEWKPTRLSVTNLAFSDQEDLSAAKISYLKTDWD